MTDSNWTRITGCPKTWPPKEGFFLLQIMFDYAQPVGMPCIATRIGESSACVYSPGGGPILSFIEKQISSTVHVAMSPVAWAPLPAPYQDKTGSDGNKR